MPVGELGSNSVSGVTWKPIKSNVVAATLLYKSFEIDLPERAEIILQQITLNGKIVSMQRYGYFGRGKYRLPISSGKGSGVRLIRILADGKSILCRRVLDIQ